MRAPALCAATPPPPTLRPLDSTPETLSALQHVLEAAPSYFETVTGGPPGPTEAHSVVTDLPPGRTYDDKVVFGLYDGERMIGCADVVRGWNAPDKAIIGLLLVAEDRQRRGFGRAFAALVEQAIAHWPEIATVRIGVIRTNAGALAFWRKQGYRETGERKHNPEFVAPIVVLEKALPR
ncbi:MAG: GNAT family N-acetyltransferase [Betaproteobacteria bacterium]